MSSSSPNIDGLSALLGEMQRQLAEHRRESRESNEDTNQKLEDIRENVSKLAADAETTRKLDRIVNGEGSDIGLRVRQDRAEQKLNVIVWVVAGIGLVIIGKFVDWVVRLKP